MKNAKAFWIITSHACNETYEGLKINKMHRTYAPILGRYLRPCNIRRSVCWKFPRGIHVPYETRCRPTLGRSTQSRERWSRNQMALEDNVKQSPHYAERPVIIFELSRFIGRWAYQVFTSCEPFNINVISHQRIGSSSDSTAMPILAVRHSVAYV